MDIMSVLIGKLWSGLVTAFPMLFGVAISLQVSNEKTHDLTVRQAASAFFFGVGISYYFSRFVAEMWIINKESFTFFLMEVVVASIGMSAMTQIIMSVPEQITKALNAIRTKFLGGE